MDQNIFNTPMELKEAESETTLLSHPKAKIKKIVSPSRFKSEVFCQNLDEWVSLVQGEATLKIKDDIQTMKTGDCLFIPANTPHQILSTSTHPLAIWLAIYL